VSGGGSCRSVCIHCIEDYQGLLSLISLSFWLLMCSTSEAFWEVDLTRRMACVITHDDF
jgi:hypothetical protein